MAIYKSALELIGRTPMVELSRFAQASGASALIIGKLERQNPGGSVKDRAALAMIEEAERTGRLGPGGTIVEPTSGNTGIGLAMVAAVKGYPLILTMPESMSIERRQLLGALGAIVELTPADRGMAGAIARAKEIVRDQGAFMPQQFDNPENPKAHAKTTAHEILEDMPDGVDVLVASVGTGGTISGIAGEIKKTRPGLCAVAVEPLESPLLSGGRAGSHGIQGIGANFIPGNYNEALIDRVFPISTQDAYEMTRLLAATEGLLCGMSSGAALRAAVTLSWEPAFAGKKIVVMLPDTGERYLSTPLFAQ